MNYMLITHDHDDHISGLIRLLKWGITPDELLCPYREGAEKNSTLLASCLKAAEKADVTVRRVSGGEEILLGEGVITLFRDEEGNTGNARSMLCRVVFGSASLLLTADIPGTSQVRLAKSCPELLKCDIIKAPHHGVTAMNSTFFQTASPQWVVITSNSERVNPSALYQAEQNGVPWSLSGDGTVVCETDGEDWYVYQLEE